MAITQFAIDAFNRMCVVVNNNVQQYLNLTPQMRFESACKYNNGDTQRDLLLEYGDEINVNIVGEQLKEKYLNDNGVM